MLGLVSPDNVPMKKDTLVKTTYVGMATNLSVLCDKSHVHETVEGSKTKNSENYPEIMGNKIASIVMDSHSRHVQHELRKVGCVGRVCTAEPYHIDATTRALVRGDGERNMLWYPLSQDSASCAVAVVMGLNCAF